jgi:hypothetical protein
VQLLGEKPANSFYKLFAERRLCEFQSGGAHNKHLSRCEITPAHYPACSPCAPRQPYFPFSREIETMCLTSPPKTGGKKALAYDKLLGLETKTEINKI